MNRSVEGAVRAVRTPRFVVLEGVEGSGKSTQIRLLSAWLEGAGIPHTAAREPGGTRVGEAIRGVLLDRDGLEVPARTELLLMLAARAAFVEGVVRPALARGEVVIADRFDLSTFAYQGFGRGLELSEVVEMNRFATGGLRPDLYVILDLPARAGEERQARQGKAPDRIEQEGPEFMERVSRGYRTLAETEGRARMLDARGTPDEVHARLRRLLEGAFPETFGPEPV